MTLFEIFQFFLVVAVFAIMVIRDIRQRNRIFSHVKHIVYNHVKESHDLAEWKHYLSHCCKRCGFFLEEGQICECVSLPEHTCEIVSLPEKS